MQKMRASPMMDIPLLNKLKRKRTDSPEALQLPGDRDVKRKRPLEAERPTAHTTGKCEAGSNHKQAPTTLTDYQETPDSQSTSMPPPSLPVDSPSTIAARRISKPAHMAPEMVSSDGGASATSTGHSLHTYSDLSPLQQTIEHQFNLEILTKHKELRLIDQELAKCQAALEQLRRCELVPYHGLTQMSEDVSFGRGPSLRTQLGHSQPTAPAPWGVTDGPYTKHFAKWLLPDPMFDSTPISQEPSLYDAFAAARADGRSTRNSIVGLGRPSKRGSRDSISSVTQTPTSQLTPSAVRNKGGPLVIKRMSDNQFVKLVCTKCHRGDFSSVQGFLNHCRIAHKLDYKSHEAAAQDCGQLLGENEQDLAATAPPPVGTMVKSTAPKPIVSTAPAVPVTSRVHPLNLQTPPRPTWKRQRLAYEQAMKNQTPTNGTTMRTSAPRSAFHSTPLVPSSSTPSLSALFAKRRLGGDLQTAASQAKEKFDLGQDDNDADEESSAKASPVSTAANGAMRTVNSGGGKATTGGYQNNKSHRPFNNQQRSRPAPLDAGRTLDMETPESPHEADLSPHTADSNPGMVSDHDDDPASDPEEDNGSVIAPSHTLSLGRSCEDAMDLDLEVDDDHEEHNVLVRSRNIRERELHGAGSPSRPRSRYDDGRK